MRLGGMRMTNKLKCPILMLNPYIQPYEQYCMEDRCAWWDGFNRRCAILTIAKGVDTQ